MNKRVELKLFPDQINDTEFLWRRTSNKINIPLEDINDVRIVRKSLDARGRRPVFRVLVEAFVGAWPVERINHKSTFINVSEAPRVVIVGAGPAGYFAALRMLKIGLKPIILERGKDVRSRRRDLRAIQQEGVVNPHSNYCFGEGGAGTYSDGKLYTRSHKRGKITEVLELFVDHGAPDDILIDAHPHIGSNQLPKIMEEMRESITSNGGEIHFDAYVTDFLIDGDTITGVQLESGDKVYGSAVLLATGHSARDIFYLLEQKGIGIEPKPYALGLRIEHPQEMIDEIQYNQRPREDNLPAASYSVVANINDRGVFSFCMCPGGLIVPASTAPGEIVVNGMSLSKRDSPFANSGLVTAVETEDLQARGYNEVFGNMKFQQEVEQRMFNAGDGTQRAPAQRVDDFIDGSLSTSLNDTSYIPGLFSANFQELLPDFIYDRLRKGLIEINKKMPHYITKEANLVGVESRTSSPIRIPRDWATYMHADVKGLFPCGEGAGYAGGILSAAMDGQNCATAISKFINH